jgi:hypothetical protein
VAASGLLAAILKEPLIGIIEGWAHLGVDGLMLGSFLLFLSRCIMVGYGHGWRKTCVSSSLALD